MTSNPTQGLLGAGLWERWAARIAQCLFGSDEKSSLNLTGSAASFSSLITSAAEQQDLSADLVAAVIRAESNFDPTAVSSAGAKGLMQLMDATAKQLGVHDSFDPAQNIEGGATYLRQMLDRYESLPLALAAYNAGPAAVDQYSGVPPYQETQQYVKRVLSFMNHDGNDWEA